MATIKIEWLEDTYECEDCGHSYAEGASVSFDDGTGFDLEPSAHCFDDTNYNKEDVYRAILAHLGYTIIETN